MTTERAEQRNAMRLDVDPIEPHDGSLGQITQLNFAFLRIKEGPPSNVCVLLHNSQYDAV